jgi:hypothetical protein
LSDKAARGGIPALRSEAIRLSAAIAACSVHLKHYQVKVDAVLAAINPAPTVDIDPHLTPIELALNPGVFDQAERIVIALQAVDPDRSVEDCLNTIFCAGLLTLA